MADPLLTKLCAICHMALPKYKCPRCTTRTCSLPCVKKHKVWSQCDGQRDATAYKPNALSTRAGVDHDYNFLSAIERQKQATEHVLVHSQGILNEHELRPLEVQHVEWRRQGGPGRGNKMKRVLVTRRLRRGAQEDDERVMARCRNLGIKLVRAPPGMSLRRQVGVKFSHKNKKVMWPVRWLLVTPQQLHGKEIWTSIADHMRIGQCFLQGQRTAAFAAASIDKRWANEEGGDDDATGGPGFALQDPRSSAWIPSQPHDCQVYRQHGLSKQGSWVQGEKALPEPTPPFPEWIKWLGNKLHFFLSRQTPNSASDRIPLTRVDPDSRLKDILSGVVVFEHPTFYVVQKQVTLPPGFEIDERHEGRAALKRSHAVGPGSTELQGEKSKKKKKKKLEDLEEGEILSGEETRNPGAAGADRESEVDDDTSTDSDVVAEIDLGDDEDDDEDDADDGRLEACWTGLYDKGLPKTGTLERPRVD